MNKYVFNEERKEESESQDFTERGRNSSSKFGELHSQRHDRQKFLVWFLVQINQRPQSVVEHKVSNDEREDSKDI